MKKYLFILFFVFMGFSCNAQIYTTIRYYDKFDDEVKVEKRKTLITKTDSTFVIEEKGKQPVVYYIMNEAVDGKKGSKDEIVNLVMNVYGYQEAWCVVRETMLDKYLEAKNNYITGKEKSMDKLMHCLLFIIHRTITTQYTGSYLDDLFWVEDELSDGKLGKDVNRIIYNRK